MHDEAPPPPDLRARILAERRRPTRLKLLRVAHGLSQADLGQLAGVDPSMISRCESGLRARSTLRQLAKVLGYEGDPLRLVELAEE